MWSASEVPVSGRIPIACAKPKTTWAHTSVASAADVNAGIPEAQTWIYCSCEDDCGRVEMAAARAEVPVAVSVIDTHGNVILKHRMSGSPAAHESCMHCLLELSPKAKELL